MIVNKSYRYRLKPTPEQEQQLRQHVGNARFIWNWCVALNKEEYEKTGKFLFSHDLCNRLPELKKTYPFLKLSVAQSLQQVTKYFEKALKNCFYKEKGFPKFKTKKQCHSSFVIPQHCKVENSKIWIPKKGWIRYIRDRKHTGKVKRIAVVREGSKWFCVLTCEVNINEQKVKPINTVGIDLGIRQYIAISDGTIIQNPKNFKKHADKIAKEQRRLSRKVKGSSNWYKQVKKVQNAYAKLTNVRKDTIHKLTSSMIAKYDGIAIEDLSISKMIQDLKYARNDISDLSFYEIRRQLEYKALWYGKHVVVIDRYDKSTQTCSECGHVMELKLSQRTYNCPVCGLKLDRDLNAAININRLGFSRINACGDEGLPSSAKQEKELVAV